MSILTVHDNGKTTELSFEAPSKLSDVLAGHKFPVLHLCGGRGICGKCRVEIEGEISPLNDAEKKVGGHLSCQTMLLGDAVLTLDKKAGTALSDIESTLIRYGGPLQPMNGKYGFAVDIGTTTVVIQLYDLSNGQLQAEASERNRQAEIAADVMGRIGASLEGKLERLCQIIRDEIRELMDKALAEAGLTDHEVQSAVITGNTTMLYLLCGMDPECLSHAPFEADCLFDKEIDLFGKTVYLPPCISAFVGADITCAVLASDMCSSPLTSLLCDVGTNGEMALWLNGQLHVCSTAAGPAFEGAGIKCGCSNIPGAIDSVSPQGDRLIVHTIGDLKATGICGSGLIDAVASLLTIGEIDETGYLEDNYVLMDDIDLSPADVRAVQLAKAAIAGGMQTLIDSTGIKPEMIHTLYLAGGFGNHLNVSSAVRIDLLPASLSDKTKPVGNAALSGAATLLLNVNKREQIRELIANAKTIQLGGNPAFNANYVDHMMFPEND